LIKLAHQPFLNVNEVGVLETSQLLQLNWPDWTDVALTTGSGGDGARYQVLVGVD